MAFVTEDGTGKSDANSYVTVAEFKAWAASNGYVITAYSDANIETAAVRTTKAVDARGLRRFVGTKLTSTQALAWPRDDATDAYGFDILTTSIPSYVKNATFEGIMAELASSGALQPTLDRGGSIQEERVEGAVTVRYFPGAPSGTVYSAYLDALSPVLKSVGVRVERV